jgi:lipoprotein-releasing system permease protein
MNFIAVKFVDKKYSSPSNREGFVDFVWWAGVVSISVGVIALILSLSILDGFYNAIKENAIRFASHIKVYTFNRKAIYNPETIVNKITGQVQNVESAYPSINREVLLRTKKTIEGISLQSLNKKIIENLRKIELGVLSINFERDFNGLLIGKMLAERLNLNVGDSVVLVSINVNDSSALPQPKFLKTTVSGLFESGMAKYDDLFVFASERLFYKLLGDSTSLANSIDVYVKNLDKINETTQQIETVLGYPYYCFTFYDLHSSIFAWIELQKEPIPIVLSLITIVAIFNVITFLLVTIVEKTKSIGILATIGMTSKEIALIFLRLGLKIAFIGLAIGVSISLVFSLLQKQFHIIHLDSKVYFFSTLPITISFENYMLVCIFTLLLTFVVCLIPSLIATKINPVNAIRFIK